MKARPILFSAPMVLALLDGRKTQTRRPIKPQPIIHDNGSYRWDGCLGGFKGCAGTHVEDFPKLASWYCPYGKVGDLIWVRESFRIESSGVQSVYYRADEEWHKGAGWKPSIHIPRWASRLTLKITNVRVERLQDISEADAKAEGCFFTDYGRKCFHQNKPPCDVGDCKAPENTHPQRDGWMWKDTNSDQQCLGSAKTAYGNLWNTINGAESWNANPFVWVIEFEVHKMNINAFINKPINAE